MSKQKILIMGAGGLGQAVGEVLSRENEVSFWDVDPTKVPGGQARPLQELLPGAGFILLCVPSWAIPGAISGIPAFDAATVVVAFSKGMDASSGQVTGELLPHLLPKGQPFAVVSGPMLAAEIAQGLRAAAVFASPDEAIAKRTAELFASPVFTAEISTDAPAVSLAGVLKNIYAISLGIADGLGLDGNAKGWLAARAANEMVAIAEVFGMDKNVILGTAGLADFIATAYSSYSRNREVGEEIVKNGKCALEGEGTASLPPLMARLGPRAAEFPLLGLIKQIAIDCGPAKPAMDAYFQPR